jgi:hypothetical protein
MARLESPSKRPTSRALGDHNDFTRSTDASHTVPQMTAVGRATGRADRQTGSSSRIRLHRRSSARRKRTGEDDLLARVDSRERPDHPINRLLACLDELHPFIRDPEPSLSVSGSDGPLCLRAGLFCLLFVFFCGIHSGKNSADVPVVCSKLLTSAKFSKTT